MTRGRRRPGGELLSAGAAARLRDAVGAWRQREGVPGVALVLAERSGRSEPFFEGDADRELLIPVGPEHRFQVGSIGKSFTAIALLRMVERGLVQLGAPLERYVPWFRAGEHGPRITIHHLLSHTSGLPAGPDFSDSSAFDVWALRDMETSLPGRYWYSNAGYKALGLVLEAIAGRAYGEVIQQEVLQPLELAATRPTIALADRMAHAAGYEPDPEHYPVSRASRVRAPFLDTSTGDGSVVSSGGDLARYLAMLLGRGTWGGRQILRPETFDLLNGRHAPTGRGASYGYGLATNRLDGRIVFGHGGDMLGFRASLLGDHATGLGVVVLANLRGARTGLLARYALRLAWADANNGPLPSFDANGEHDPRPFAGGYAAPTSRMVITVDGGRASMEQDGRSCQLIPREPDAFEVDDAELGRFVLRFVRDRSGRIRGATHGCHSYQRSAERASGGKLRRSRASVFAGRYRSHNPWRRLFDVVNRDGRLVIVEADGSEQSLVELSPGRYREGARPNPERVVFDAYVDGRPLRAIASGHPHYRASES